MKALFFTDCDDTLFKTARKIEEVKLEECEVASTLEDGRPSGYRTPRLKFLQNLMSAQEVVPVTARSVKVLARCDVPQIPSVCSNGGIIIGADGNPDPDWQSKIRNHIGDGKEIRDIYSRLSERTDSNFRHWIVEEYGDPMYLCFKHNIHEKHLDSLHDYMKETDVLPEGWKIHKNSNNIAILPSWISKRKAVRYLIDKVRNTEPNRLIIGVGDSLSDLGFMEECDFSMFPNSSQIASFVGKMHSW
jgi:hydroxymethylpyrimidine pyrophosphatase-like HAD family hydrolase